MAEVVVVPPPDRHRAVATLALAFVGDPVVRWALPDAHGYATAWPRIVEAFGGRAFDTGTAYATDGFSGIALWLPPGVGPDSETMATVVYESAATAARPDLDGFFEQMDTFHPLFDHWYLPLTGVDPPAQGRGLGSILMRHGLEASDRDGIPAYLEATSPRSRDLYARHGFVELGIIQQGGSPPMWPMLRPPAARPRQ